MDPERLAEAVRPPLTSAEAARSCVDELLRIASRHGARNVRVFGSVARGESRPDSDLDLLVDLDPERTLLDLIGLRQAATDLLGRQVDAATPEMLREHVRLAADRDAIAL